MSENGSTFENRLNQVLDLEASDLDEELANDSDSKPYRTGKLTRTIKNDEGRRPGAEQPGASARTVFARLDDGGRTGVSEKKVFARQHDTDRSAESTAHQKRRKLPTNRRDNSSNNNWVRTEDDRSRSHHRTARGGPRGRAESRDHKGSGRATEGQENLHIIPKWTEMQSRRIEPGSATLKVLDEKIQSLEKELQVATNSLTRAKETSLRQQRDGKMEVLAEKNRTERAQQECQDLRRKLDEREDVEQYEQEITKLKKHNLKLASRLDAVLDSEKDLTLELTRTHGKLERQRNNHQRTEDETRKDHIVKVEALQRRIAQLEAEKHEMLDRCDCAVRDFQPNFR